MTDSKPGPKTTIKDVQSQVDSLSENMEKLRDSANQAIQGLSVDFQNSVEQIMAAISAKNNPVVIRDTVEADEQFLGEEGYMEYDQDNIEVGRPGLHDVNSPEFKEKSARLAFMKEMVGIQILDTSDKDADPNFMVSVNGEKHYFFRNHQYLVPRYIVETLARAKPVNYENESFRNNDGMTDYRQRERKGLRYGFAVTEDTPQGKAWLKRVLSEAA